MGGPPPTLNSDAHINPPPSNPRTCCYGLSCPKGASRAAQHRSRGTGRGAGVRQVCGLGEPTPHPQSLTPTSTPPLYQPQNLLQRTLLSQRGQQSRPAPFQASWLRSWGQASGWLSGGEPTPHSQVRRPHDPPPSEPIPVCCIGLSCPRGASRAAQLRPSCPGRGAGPG